MPASCIIKDYIAPFIPLVAAFAVYFLGKSAYFRQKEYELITKRYLEEGIDAISKNVDRSLALFRHNWWQSTVVLKHFRDLGKDIRSELYEKPFISPDPTFFEVWRDYRLHDIVGDDVFDRAHQSLDAFIRSSYAFFQDDLCTMVRVTLEGGKELEVKATRDEMVKSYLEEIELMDQRSLRYYVLLQQLQDLSSMIQTERFSFKKLQELQTREQVKNSVNILKENFADTLEKDEALHSIQEDAPDSKAVR